MTTARPVKSSQVSTSSRVMKRMSACDSPYTAVVKPYLVAPTARFVSSVGSGIAFTGRTAYVVAKEKVNGKPNPHVPEVPGSGFFGHLLTSKLAYNDLDVILGMCHEAAKGKGYAKLRIGDTPVYYLEDPRLSHQLSFHTDKLVDGETGPLQQWAFGNWTHLAHKRTSPLYQQMRKTSLRNFFEEEGLKKLLGPMRTAMTPYFQALQAEAKKTQDQKQPAQVHDLEELALRIGMTVISRALGITNFTPPADFKTEPAKKETGLDEKEHRKDEKKTDLSPEEALKARFSHVVHHTITSLSKLSHFIAISANRPPQQLEAWKQEGETILKHLIENTRPENIVTTDGQNTVKIDSPLLVMMKSLSGKENLTHADLTSPEMMSRLKTHLIGGLHTSATVLFFAFLVLGNVENKTVIRNMRKEIDEMKREKPIDEWTLEDIAKLNYVNGVFFELMRKYPPFCNNRNTTTQPIVLSPSVQEAQHNKKYWKMSPAEKKADYLKRFNARPARDKDFTIPADAVIFKSPYYAHRDGDVYSHPQLFKPSRWLDTGFNLDTNNLLHNPAFDGFGTDVRGCLGRRSAQLGTILELVKLVDQFDLRSQVLDPEGKPIALEDALQLGFVINLKPGYRTEGTFSLREQPQLAHAETMESKSSPSKGFRG